MPFPFIYVLVARSGPLIPVSGILLIALLLGAAIFAATRPRIRARTPWLAPELGAFSALALLHLLFFWQPYRTGALVPRGGGDLASFFYPMHAFAAGEVQAGRLPFWNPHLFSGAPHLANFQTATLYPLNLLAYLIARPFEYSTLELLAIAHFLLASYGTYWLARALGMSRAGGVLAGTIYAYSGFLVAHLGHYPMLSTASWAPFVLAAIVGSVRRRSWPIALGGTLALACAILGGHQPILLMTLTAAVVVALFELSRSTEYARLSELVARDGVIRRDWRASPLTGNVARLGFMALVAVGMAAPVLGPSFEMNDYTIRTGLGYEAASEFSVQPVALLHLFLPTIFGSNPTDYWGPFSNTEIWGYTGVLALALGAFGLVVRPTWTRVFWFVAAIVSILFLLGPFATVHGWAYAFLPGYDRIRGAGRAFMFFDLAVAVLAGFGLDGLLGRYTIQPATRASMLRWGVIGLSGALLLVIGVVIPLFTSNVIGVNDPGNRPVIALDNAIMLAIWLSLGVAVALIAWRTPLRGGPLVILVVGVIVLELFHATAPFNPTTDPILSGFDHQEVVTFLQERERQDGPFRIDVTTGRWQPNLALWAGIDDIGGLFDPLAIKTYDDFIGRVRRDRSSAEYMSLNVRYIVSDVDGDQPVAGAREVYRSTQGIVVWELAEWLPRAWILGTDTEVPIVERRPGYLRLSLPGDASGRLVLSQTHYPGWTARVDGAPAPLGSYNVVLQTLEIPAGARTVELTFRPRNWSLWLGIGVISLIVWIAATVTSLWMESLWRVRSRKVASLQGTGR